MAWARWPSVSTLDISPSMVVFTKHCYPMVIHIVELGCEWLPLRPWFIPLHCTCKFEFHFPAIRSIILTLLEFKIPTRIFPVKAICEFCEYEWCTLIFIVQRNMTCVTINIVTIWYIKLRCFLSFNYHSSLGLSFSYCYLYYELGLHCVLRTMGIHEDIAADLATILMGSLVVNKWGISKKCS